MRTVWQALVHCPPTPFPFSLLIQLHFFFFFLGLVLGSELSLGNPMPFCLWLVEMSYNTSLGMKGKELLKKREVPEIKKKRNVRRVELLSSFTPHLELGHRSFWSLELRQHLVCIKKQMQGWKSKMHKMAEEKKERFWELEYIFWFTFSHKQTLQLPSYKLVVQIDDRWRGGMESWLGI